MSGRLDRARALMAWLTSDAMRDESGWVLSWANSNSPGYPYPEASAYLLQLLARWPEPASGPMSQRARELQESVEKRLVERGALGRCDIDYVFDTAIGLAGLQARAAAGSAVSARALEAGRDFVVDGLERGAACRRDGSWFVDPRWSLSFQPHLLKCLRAFHGSEQRALLERMTTLLGAQKPGGAFALSNTDVIDTHVHAYAIEGLLALEPTPAIEASIRRGVEQLATVQLTDGGVPRHIPGDPIGCCDTTAQAVRLFILADRERYASNIARGLDFLESLAHPLGGLRYHAGTQDCPSWGAVFACQAWLMLDERQGSRDLI